MCPYYQLSHYETQVMAHYPRHGESASVVWRREAQREKDSGEDFGWWSGKMVWEERDWMGDSPRPNDEELRARSEKVVALGPRKCKHCKNAVSIKNASEISVVFPVIRLDWRADCGNLVVNIVPSDKDVAKVLTRLEAPFVCN